MKLKSVEERTASARKGGFASAALLVGGMALLPNCAPGVYSRQIETPPQQPTVSVAGQNVRVSAQPSTGNRAAGDVETQRELGRRMLEAGREAGLEPSRLESIANVQFETTRRVVRVGDSVSCGPGSGSLPLGPVTAIDANGVDFGEYGRIEYNRPQFIGEFAIQMRISAEPGPDGTATISATYPIFEIKRTHSERLSPSGPAAPSQEYQTSGPVQK